jgi:hypothetical protein
MNRLQKTRIEKQRENKRQGKTLKAALSRIFGKKTAPTTKPKATTKTVGTKTKSGAARAGTGGKKGTVKLTPKTKISKETRVAGRKKGGAKPAPKVKRTKRQGRNQ